MRRIFIILGAIGIAYYLEHLAVVFFKDSIVFPVALSAIGFLIIYLGVIWQHYETKITYFMQALLPQKICVFIEKCQKNR